MMALKWGIKQRKESLTCYKLIFSYGLVATNEASNVHNIYEVLLFFYLAKKLVVAVAPNSQGVDDI